MTTRSMRTTRALAVACLTAMAAALVAQAALARATHQDATVSWHPQTGSTDVVDGATGHVTRNDDGIAFRLRTNSLTPGNAYTLWLVIVNHPEECDATPCTAPEIIGNDDTASQVGFAAGNVVGEAGRATFSGHVNEGPLDGWLPDRSLEDARGAEVHLVINDHGPALAEHMPGMIRTYRGGCSDDSPFPGVFPPVALEDGEPGPNTCLLTQSAVFTVE